MSRQENNVNNYMSKIDENLRKFCLHVHYYVTNHVMNLMEGNMSDDQIKLLEYMVLCCLCFEGIYQ